MRPGPRHGFRWTRETVLYAFELWHRRHLRAPRAIEWRAAGADHPSVTTVRRVFGSWQRAVRHAGLARAKRTVGQRPPAPLPRWPAAEAVDAIRRWAALHDVPPTWEEWRRGGLQHPSAYTIRRRFGSWNAGLEAAGFTPRTSRAASEMDRHESVAETG